MVSAEPIQIPPPSPAEKLQIAQLYHALLEIGAASLIGPKNTKIEVPPFLYDMLVKVVETMQEGKVIALLPLTEQMTTQAAADLLGVSRQFLVRELEAQKIPFHYAGTHRRVYLKDVLEYKNTRMRARRVSIDRMAQKAEALGDYDRFIPPEE